MTSRSQHELKIAGKPVRLGGRTLIVGVVNATPDSFSDGGLFLDPSRAIEHGLELVRQGADWIDVGGESTRPGSKPVSAEEEVARVLPVIRGLHRRRPALPISIDTTKAPVAEAALGAGANIINDVSGLRFDSRLADVAREHRAALILMHLRGRPETMQREPFATSVWRSLRDGLLRAVERARAAGVSRSQLIIDPGLGFGKSRRQNYEILAHLDRLREFRLPILVGTSRKSFVQAIVRGEGLDAAHTRRSRWPLTVSRRVAAVSAVSGRGPTGGTREPTVNSNRELSVVTQALQTGDAAAVVAAILAGAHLVRVHDVAAVLPAVRIADAILSARASR